MLSTQMLAHVKGHSALLICTVCLENAPKSKGIEATTTGKVTAHNPGGPGTASASESWALGPRHLASAAASGKVGSVLGSARSTTTPLLSNGSDDSSPGGSVTVGGSDGQNQERSQNTAHNTRTDMLHTCTRDNFRENTPYSGLRQTEAGNIAGSRVPAPTLVYRAPRRCLRRDTLRSSFLRPQKQTRTIKRFLYTDLSQ